MTIKAQKSLSKMDANPDGRSNGKPLAVTGQAPRSYMAAAPVGAARKKHPGKAIMAGNTLHLNNDLPLNSEDRKKVKIIILQKETTLMQMLKGFEMNQSRLPMEQHHELLFRAIPPPPPIIIKGP